MFFEALLILDMFTHCCRAFYNTKGILVYDLKDIRTKYLSSRFFPDLIAALPLQAVVALNGNVNYGYSAWLRMPKMIRVYRLIQIYAALQKETGHVGVAVGVLRQLPLLFCLTHLYGCASPDSALRVWGECMYISYCVTFQCLNVPSIREAFVCHSVLGFLPVHHSPCMRCVLTFIVPDGEASLQASGGILEQCINLILWQNISA
jgi:hypothetical protein